MAAQAVHLGKLSCGMRKVRVETDDTQLRAEPVDSLYRMTQACSSDPAAAMRSGRNGPCLGIDELTRHDRVGAIPQLDGKR